MCTVTGRISETAAQDSSLGKLSSVRFHRRGSSSLSYPEPFPAQHTASETNSSPLPTINNTHSFNLKVKKRFYTFL